MRLIFLNRYFWPDESATSQMLSDLAFHLARRRFAVIVVTSRLRYEDPSARLPTRERKDGLEVFRVWSTRFGRRGIVGRAFDYLTFYVSAFLFLLFRSRRGDLVISKTDPPLLGIFAAILARLRRIQRINWLQDIFPEVAQAERISLTRGFLGRIARLVRDWSLDGAINVVLGKRMGEFVRGVRPGARVEVIPNWADGEAIRPIPVQDHPLRKAWGLENHFVVCYSGNLGRVHADDVMVEAAEHLRDKPDITLLFIGGGSRNKQLQIEVTQRGLTNVVFRPYEPRERLGHSLTVADVHLVNLRPEFEGLIVPSKYYGVAAAGRPCIFIGDPEGEIGRLILKVDAGITVVDGQQLADAILYLQRNPERCRAMGIAARQQFEHEFDKSIALARWEALVASLR